MKIEEKNESYVIPHNKEKEIIDVKRIQNKKKSKISAKHRQVRLVASL